MPQPAHRDVAVYVGLDVGKSEHHAVALTASGKRLFDRALPNSESRLRALFAKLARHGTVLVVVDQHASIGALPLAVARDAGALTAYLPSLAMRRIADLYPGAAKTDARDAFVIADAARTMPHTLRDVRPDDETVATLGLILGFDEDLAAEATRATNRIRALLTAIHPHLERVLGPRCAHPAVLALLQCHGSPADIRAAGRDRITALLREHAPRLPERLAQDIFAALDEQSVTVPGTDAAAVILPGLALSLANTLRQRAQLAQQIESLLEAPRPVVRMHPQLTGHLPDHRLGLGRPVIATARYCNSGGYFR